MAMTLRPSDAEARALRRRAEHEGRPMQRLALAAVIAFYGVNGRRLTLTNDSAYGLVIDVATGRLDSAEEIAGRLRSATEPRS